MWGGRLALTELQREIRVTSGLTRRGSCPKSCNTKNKEFTAAGGTYRGHQCTVVSKLFMSGFYAVPGYKLQVYVSVVPIYLHLFEFYGNFGSLLSLFGTLPSTYDNF